ncbi:MAG TPA: multicopper oxidase domain-containing protein [Bryobacteraceae bacterium]|nr:multicopper oxidase domain-containing protein [Bryobacteraceae bacterium]
MNDEQAARKEPGGTRREFLSRALAASAGLALGSILPHSGDTVEAQTATCVTPGETLVEIAAIKKPTPNTPGPVRGVIKILNEKKAYWGGSKTGGPPVCETGQMRYFAASLPNGPQIWPLKPGIPAPGPTIRARVGDSVEITLLNQVDVSAFGNSLDTGERGDGCDVATMASPNGSLNIYPGNPPFDNMPNCYHGSSTANLHYHGTHVSPNVIQDNVFVQLRPSPRANGTPVVNEEFLKKYDFGQIFANCQAGHSPMKWEDLPAKWRGRQESLLKDYDNESVWQGKKGATPVAERLWTKDSTDIMAGRWPQYYIGAYPSCLKLPVWNGQENSMGQAPGTHWYHAHKHGSTSLNLANGMAGAFIIEGDYDDKLKPLFNKEVVLVLQTYAAQIGTLRAPDSSTSDLVFVNGQFTPTLEMQPGEVQLWRIVNACSGTTLSVNGPPNSVSQPGPKWIQTAQDGVQLDPANYALGVKIAETTTPGTWTNATLKTPMTDPPWFGNLAPGNRVDMLVQAPASGTFRITAGSTLLFTVKVTQNPIANPPNFPPPQSAFPPKPGFLNDLDPGKVSVYRKLRFKTTAVTGGPPGFTIPSSQTIDGKRFEDHEFNQTMQLGATEEWTLYNEGGPAHPFHIHVNPFQVTEIKLSATADPIKLPQPWIWWDNIAIPTGGYIKMLSRFADFTGAYVLHCHILDHEDRGMMQMVRVVETATTLGHH